MNDVLHWIIVGFCFGIGFAAAQAVYAAIVRALGGNKDK